ncbi:MAG: lamin tail domain-containing protein [Gaiellaceae bacterium]
MPSSYVGRWAWFPGGTLAALRGMDNTSVPGTTSVKVFLFSLISPTPAPREVVGPLSANGAVINFHAHASPDSSLVLIYLIDDVQTSSDHRILRTDNGANQLTYGGVTSPEFRAAEVTAGHALRLFTSPAPQPNAGSGTTIFAVQLPQPVAITGGVFNAVGADLPKEVVNIESCGTVSIDLTGWTLSDRQHHVYTFPAFTLAAKAKVNVWTKAGPNSATDLFMGYANPVWTNTGDVAILRDAAGTEVSRFDYPGGATPGGGGGVGIPHVPVDPPPPLVSSAVFDVPEDTTGVDTGIDLLASDWIDVMASGAIWAGVALTGENGPQGWDWVDHDPKFPLHDGVYAHPFSLIAFMRSASGNGAPFYIGDAFLARTPQAGRLILRTNDDVPGNGSGAFRATVGVRRASSTTLPPPRPVVTVDVPESSSGVDTGVDVAEGEYLQIDANGSIWAGVWLTGENGPEGWSWIDHDPKFPLHSGPFARPFALIGHFESSGTSDPFYVGKTYGPQKQGPPFTGRLFLRTNDDTPGNGSGAFQAAIRVRPAS